MEDFLLAVSKDFKAHQNPKQAVPMAAYMKNKFPFLGIKTPERRTLIQNLKTHWKPDGFKEIESITLHLWAMEEREYQYAAMDLLMANKKLWSPDLPELVERLVLNKSWWDTVDCLASQIFGNYWLKSKTNEPNWPQLWLDSDNLWLKRTALIFQLSFREKTNEAFLKKAIIQNMDSVEFFIQKAIGWALRQYARTNPNWVLQTANQLPLKPLSRREALKHLEKVN